MDFLKFRQLALSIVGCEGYPNRMVKEGHSRGWVLGARDWGRTVGRGGKAEQFQIQNPKLPRPSHPFFNDSMAQ
jgi:hypothetical protein